MPRNNSLVVVVVAGGIGSRRRRWGGYYLWWLGSGEKRLSRQISCPKSQQKQEVLTHNQRKVKDKSKALTKLIIYREILKTFTRTTAVSRKIIWGYFGRGGGNIN